jgi:hypothetical protein
MYVIEAKNIGVSIERNTEVSHRHWTGWEIRNYWAQLIEVCQLSLRYDFIGKKEMQCVWKSEQ